MGEDSWKKRQNKCVNQKDRKINVEKKKLEWMQKGLWNSNDGTKEMPTVTGVGRKGVT